MKWEYKTLIIAYPVTGAKGPLSGPEDWDGCKLTVDTLNSSQTDPCIMEDGNADTTALLNRLGQDG
jgi:hypothetical protein